MIIKTIESPDDSAVTLTIYVQEPNHEMPQIKTKPGILICPGGGYQACSKREGEIVALQYLKEGYQAFVLEYSLKEKSKYPKPLMDAEWALSLIRKNHEEWSVYPDQIAVIGFSAGAHLATMLATSGAIRPNALIVGYPTLFRVPVFGFDYPLPEVDQDTPQGFIFHTYFDDYVPVKNTMYLSNQYHQNGIPFEVHIFRDGKHGLSLGNRLVLEQTEMIDPHYQHWFELSIEWLDKVFIK